MSHNAIVIGAGVAGLASSIRLAAKGFSVTVFEKNSYPGGKLSHFDQDGYSFDAGPSLFTQPHLLEELFAAAGKQLKDYLNYESVPFACHYFYPNGTKFKAPANPNELAKTLEEHLGESSEVVLNYLQKANQLYNQTGHIFLEHSLHRKETLRYINWKKALGPIQLAHLFQSMHQFNTSTFKNPQTVQLFNRYATYNGSNPYQAPAMLTMIPHLEINEGTFYPKGGMISITNALYKLASELGVVFEFETPVESIIHSEGKAKGIVANKKNYFADVVVSNMDAYFTYKNLLKLDRKAAGILKQERSSSALIFYWGIRHSFSELGLHNIFFTENYQKEFNALFVTKQLYNDPTIYINITSKMEEGVHAPANHENWFVMINAPANVGQNWEELKRQARNNILAKLKQMLGTDIEPLIATEAILDPVTIESKTSSYQGSLYGTSSNSKWAAFLRHPNAAPKIKKLYLAGGSVHPGGGIPLCLQSAKITANLISQDYHLKG